MLIIPGYVEDYYLRIFRESQERAKRRVEILSGDEPITDQLCKEYKSLQNYIMPVSTCGPNKIVAGPFFSWNFDRDNLRALREMYKKKKYQT